MNLPKKYLSYSAISLWEKNKDGFRKKYYENVPQKETPEMIYGKKIAKLLETGRFIDHQILGKIPRYSKPECKIEVMIEDVPVLGFLDSFNPETNAFIEYKTGRETIDGRPRWDKVAVHKHEQLDMYSLLIKEKYGSVDNLCHLVWLRTIFEQKTKEFSGMTLTSDTPNVRIDGHFEVFERRIFEYERQAIKDKIIKIAKEIEEDYEYYQKTHETVLPEASEETKTVAEITLPENAGSLGTVS